MSIIRPTQVFGWLTAGALTARGLVYGLQQTDEKTETTFRGTKTSRDGQWRQLPQRIIRRIVEWRNPPPPLDHLPASER